MFASFRAGVSHERADRKRKLNEQRREEMIIGVLTPIAAAFETGHYTEEQARSAAGYFTPKPDVLDRWISMPPAERAALGQHTMALQSTPAYQA